ncbi:MAG: hypothetical protein ABSC01_02480 [Verrucomicrobiota bacterium]|jgi:hypothetical protein
MKILSKLLGRASDLADVEPLIALFLGAALLAVFLTALFRTRPASEPGGGSSLLWTLYRNSTRLFWAVLLVALLAGAISVLRIYLRKTLSNFQGTHGRITQANYNAVQTIWGAEQQQSELNVDIYHTVETTERIESEDPTKPALLRKKTVHVSVTGNPFVAARHEVTLRQNPRKKGSAFYGGYENDCNFTWKLRNPADTAQKCTLTFPLPASGAMYDELSATLDGQDVLPEMQIKDSSLVLERDVQPHAAMDFRIAFKSRGLSFWYFQVREPREIRDFTLTLNLPDLPKAKLNYPDGCMTPTDIKPGRNGQGTVLTYRLDHALTDKGMGIALPQLPQPGETTRAVLYETERAWLLLFALLSLSLTLAAVPHAVPLTILFSTAVAFGYGLLADFSDLLFGFWGTAALILLPLFLLLAWLLMRAAKHIGQWLAMQLLLFGIMFPCVAGLDASRATLYLDLCGLVLLAFVAWLLASQAEQPEPAPQPAALDRET